MYQSSESSPVGHLVVHLGGDGHPQEVEFSFERLKSRIGGAFGASLLTHIVFVALFFLAVRYGPQASSSSQLVQPDSVNTQIVWLAEPGPGGGGGGGGNKSPEPPRKAELPGKEKLTVPVMKTETPVPTPEDQPPQQTLDIPAKSMAADLDAAPVPGTLDGTTATTSQGTGTGGGGGTGVGSGIGSGTGSGLGPGYGGGTGGGAYRPGNGVESPRLLQKKDPQYTPDAMRAKVQGTVEIECIVETNGNCSHIEVVRSLDRAFGLDEEAIKAVRQWRFVPGKRLGEEVPVIVTIELTFTLR